jgi:nitrite reductase/ring-hydroxylating ferredoxin subunit
MADDAPTVILSSPVAVSQALAGMSQEARAEWRLADLPGRPSPAERGLDIPFPFGWFPVLLCDELAAGEVKPLRYFGRDLVIWRGEDGQPRMLDAHCRHLGAHLGHGGRVVGNLVECPFHAWQYDGQGVVQAIPYAERIPPSLTRPCERQWPLAEANRMIWVWYHPDGAAPAWAVEHFPETSDPGWTDYDIHEWRVYGAIQNMAENGVDTAHFRFVHGTADLPASEMIWEGYRRASILDAPLDTPTGRVNSRIEARQYGPGQTSTRFSGLAETLLVAAVTPVEKDEVRVRFCFTQPKEQREGLAAMVAAGFVAEVCRQLDQDKVIWDRQHLLAKPTVCDGDGPILPFRQWYRQFYAEWADAG